MTAVLTRLRNFWYAPAPAARLGVLRAVIGAFALWYVFTRRDTFASDARSSKNLFDPVGVFRVLDDPMTPVAADWIVWITIIAGVFFVLGLLHRAIAPVFAIALMLTLMYRNCWSMIYHMNNALVIHVLILAFVRSADAFSLDSLIRARRGERAPQPSEDYGWPVQLICAVTVAGYFLSGYAKLVGPQGLSWAHGTALREQIATDTIRKEVLEGYAMPLAYLLWDNIWIFTVIGVTTLVLELVAPLFLFSRRAGRLWAVAAWLMHWGIFFIMGIKFRYQLSFIIFLPFFRVELLAFYFQRLLSTMAAMRRGKALD